MIRSKFLPIVTSFRLSHRLGDCLAIGLSSLCLVHCMASLLLFAAIGGFSLGAVTEASATANLGAWWLHPNVHIIGLVAAIGLGALSLLVGILRHRLAYPSLIVGAGLVLMTIAVLVPHGAEELGLMLVGVAMVGYGHWRNMRTPCACV